MIRIAQNAKRRNRRVARATMSSRWGDEIRSTRTLAFSASCVSALVRNKAAHPVSGHKAKSEYRRHKFNALDHENLPSLGALESCCGATKMRRSCSEECPGFMHCVETSAVQLHKQNPLQLTGKTSAANDGSIKLCAQMRSSSSADAEAGRGCHQSTHLVKSTYVFNCGGQLIAEESTVAKISNSGEKVGF